MGNNKLKMKLSTFALATITFTSIEAIPLDKVSEQITQFAEIAHWSEKDYRSGEVVSNETFTYGKFIARIKGEDKLGTCTSFFSFWEGTDEEPWEMSNWSEIDGVELVPSAYWGTMSTNIIWENQQMNPE